MWLAILNQIEVNKNKLGNTSILANHFEDIYYILKSRRGGGCQNVLSYWQTAWVKSNSLGSFFFIRKLLPQLCSLYHSAFLTVYVPYFKLIRKHMNFKCLWKHKQFQFWQNIFFRHFFRTSHCLWTKLKSNYFFKCLRIIKCPII